MTLNLIVNIAKKQGNFFQRVNSVSSKKGKNKVKFTLSSESTSYNTSTWNKLKNYIKIGKENKYKCIEEQFIENKKMFEELYEQAKTMLNLLEEEEK